MKGPSQALKPPPPPPPPLIRPCHGHIWGQLHVLSVSLVPRPSQAFIACSMKTRDKSLGRPGHEATLSKVYIYTAHSRMKIVPLTRTCRTANNWLSATPLYVSNSDLIACGCKLTALVTTSLLHVVGIKEAKVVTRAAHLISGH